MPARSRRPSGGRRPARWVSGLIIRIPRKAWLVVGALHRRLRAHRHRRRQLLLGAARPADRSAAARRARARAAARLRTAAGAVQGTGARPATADRPAERSRLRGTRAHRACGRIRDRPRRHRAHSRATAITRAPIVRVVFDPEKPATGRLPAAGRPCQPADGRRCARPARHARSAAPDRAHQHEPREAAAGAAFGHSAAHGAGGPRHRGPPLLRPPRRRPDPHRRRA